MDIEKILQKDTPVGEISASDLLSTMMELKTNSSYSFEMLIDLFGIDLGVESNPRFKVIYNLLSLQRNQRLQINAVVLTETMETDSVVKIWPSANWYEREVFDMFGIKFKGHPDLRRILTAYGFEQYPLRKDAKL